MRTQKMILSLLVAVAFILSASIAAAGDFGWVEDFNIKAEADRDGFRAQLSTRFNIAGAQVDVVLGSVKNPADAYMVLRLGEMSSKPVGYVLDRYQAQRDKGWGALAHSLGIKPGSKEFHALKHGSDMYGNTYQSKGNKKGKGKG